MSGRNRSRSAIEWQDIVASSYVVGTDLIECDYLTHQEALDNLPLTGGGIYTLPGTYSPTVTITLPDKNVKMDFGNGAIFSVSTAMTLFTVPNGLTARRYYDFCHLTTTTNSLANQKFIELADSESRGVVRLYACTMTGWNVVFNVSAADLDYITPVDLFTYDCWFAPATGRSDNRLVQTVNPAGSYTNGCVLWATNTFFNEEDAVGAGYQFDDGFDLICTGFVYFLLRGTCKFDGLQGPVQLWSAGVFGVGAAQLELKSGNYWANQVVTGAHASFVVITLSGSKWEYRTNIQSQAAIIANTPNCVIDIRNISGLVAAVVVDVLSTASRCVISGNFIGGDPATAAIRLNSCLHTRIYNSYFAATGTHNTVLETGTADYTWISSSPGIASGAGAVFTGSSSFMEEEQTFNCYLQLNSATELLLARDKGKFYAVNGELEALDSPGFTITNTDNLISNTGADAGAAPAINNLYYVYVSSRHASFAPRQIRLSATAPSTTRGIEMLGTTGNALNWRFVGFVYAWSNGGTVNFRNDEAARTVINRYNQRDLSLRGRPGYVNDNAITTFTKAPTAGWVLINGGVGDNIYYIDDGRNNAVCGCGAEIGIVDSAADFWYIGIGVDTAVSAEIVAQSPYDGAGLACEFDSPQLTHIVPTVNPGNIRSLFFLLWNDGANNVTIYADEGRTPSGQAFDMPETQIWATVKG